MTQVYLTAQRLLASGYERHEMLHMLAARIAEQIYATLHDHVGAFVHQLHCDKEIATTRSSSLTRRSPR